MTEIIIYSSILSLFLVLSFFFSGTETAFFALNNLEREAFKKKELKPYSFVKMILAQPDTLLVTVLTGNMFVNVFATDLFDTHILPVLVHLLNLPEDLKILGFLHFNEFFAIIVMTVLLLIFGEMLPKNLAVRYPVSFASFSVWPLYLSERVLKPLTLFLDWLRHRLTPRVSRTESGDEAMRNDLLNLSIQIGFKEKMLNKFEVDLFESYLEFSETTAKEVMIPRIALRGVDISTKIPELLNEVPVNSQTEALYIYVYNKDFDHIEGFIDIKDLLPYKFGLKKGFELAPLIKPLYSIPSSKKLNDLIKDMKDQDLEVAHVVDEYGGTAGVLTFTHLIQELFDHFYFFEENNFIPLENGWYQVGGQTEVEELEEMFNVQFDTENRTLSGMIIEAMEEIPEAGKSINIQGIDFRIVKPGKNKILQLEVRFKE